MSRDADLRALERAAAKHVPRGFREQLRQTSRSHPAIIAELKKALPRQPLLFPDGDLTDKTSREIAAEMVREQCFLRLKEEIPYGVAVLVEEFKEKEPPEPIVIKATIFVEKDSQKGIVIGAGGKQLKAIGISAREEIEKTHADSTP